MSKIEKILCSFIVWVYLGGLLGFLLAILIGGRGGMFFVMFGLYSGILIGFFRSVYLLFRYKAASLTEFGNRKRIVMRRIFFVFLYVFAVYTLIINILYPVQW